MLHFSASCSEDVLLLFFISKGTTEHRIIKHLDVSTYGSDPPRTLFVDEDVPLRRKPYRD